ncbi:DNA binding domain-containing protein, excisionase family [Nocardiopsis flavescens]|uniref:DNA binding domain-containing protein, excisionase family n=1 Tax=Nocardiopsis flavescens TaxID=758803 RepID=A0A1M6RD47_9ACTN|nr:helix-turn-helix domain-containing protein [Nocardiopsis flavescens]SHK30372.1 DNA binding domain-containing protein, excisionase family [Nocardiopsis flavescens]
MTAEQQNAKRGSTTAARLWTLEETAGFLGVPETTLYQWRHKRTGPPSHRVGRHVRYYPEAVHEWVRSQA